MFRTMDDFMNAFDSLVDGTTRIFNQLTDEIIHQEVADGYRELGHIAWHIVATVPEMMNRTGLGLSQLDPQAPPARLSPKARPWSTETRTTGNTCPRNA